MTDAIKKSIQLRTGIFSSTKLDYRLRFSKRSRRARIKVDADGVEVILPDNSSSEHAERMIREYADWILKKVALFDELQKRELNRTTAGGEKAVLFHGRLVKISSSYSQHTGGRARVVIHGDKILLHANGLSRAQASAMLQKSLKEQARLEINVIAQSMSQKMGAVYTRLTIRDQRTRWGACSARKSLSFNWRLVMAPPEVAEYVVVHELAHLIEMNHSPRFWKVVEKYCPDYKKRRLWLKKNGHLLRPDFISLV